MSILIFLRNPGELFLLSFSFLFVCVYLCVSTEASTSVAIVDLTKDSNDSCILSGDVVDLTEINGAEERDEGNHY